MAWSRKLAVAIGAGLEALAVLAALDGAGALTLAAHLAASGAIALGLGRRPPTGRPAGLVLAMAMFLPVLGALGWIAVASVRPAASAPPRSAHVRTPIPGPEAARVHAGRPQPPPGAPSRARVLAARDRNDPGAIALLRRALSDRDEDVRLVAHAVLESKQRASYRRVHDATDELEAAPAERRGMLHRGLAAEHWELARTGLADGECLSHTLERARHHVRAAAAEHPGRASLVLLQAIVELRSGNAAGAEAALVRAMELGLPPQVAAPYLAEVAFLERRFDRVPERLAAAPAESAAIDRIRRFWS